MKHRTKHLRNLLQASQSFLEHPNDKEKWLTFQKALQTVEDFERAEQLVEQPNSLTPPERRRILRRYYEEEFRSTRQILGWSSLVVVVILGAYLLGEFAIKTLQNAAATAVAVTVTSAPSPSSTATFTATTTATATSTATATATTSATTTATSTLTPSGTFTSTRIPTFTRTASPTLTPTRTPTEPPTATAPPPLTTGQIEGTLSSTAPVQRHEFQGHIGDLITISLYSEDFDPYLSLQDSNGAVIAADDDCGSLLLACIGPIQLTNDDVYVIIVESFDRRGTGTYSLDIAVFSPTSDLTQTPSAVASCSAELPRVVIVTSQDSINLRSGPARSYPLVGFAYNGECFTVIGRNQNSSWFEIRITPSRTGWVLASLAQLQGMLNNVPVTSE